MLLAVLIDQHIGAALHGVTWCVDHLHLGLAHIEHFAIRGHMCLETRFGCRAVNDSGAGLRSQIQVTAHEIGMEVGLEDILDRCPVGGSLIDVRLHLPQGVEDGHLTIAFKVVGSMCDASGIDLLDLHGSVGFAISA